MLGLLYKDLCIMKKELLVNGSIIAVLLMALICFPITKVIPDVTEVAFSIGLIRVMVLFSVYIVLTQYQNMVIQIDEKRIWSNFVMSNPLGYKQQLLSKYFFTLSSSWLFVVIAILGEIIAGVIPGTVSGTYSWCMLFFYGQILYQSFDFPFTICYGASYGVRYRMALFLLLFYLFMAYILFADVPSTDKIWEYVTGLLKGEVLLPKWVQYMSVLLPYVSMGAFYISYKISCRLYRKGVERYEA